MINKFYKRIHNKYSNFFKFFFFLRYVFVIFFISTFIFLLIPKYFNYEKKIDIIKNYLLESYDLDIKNYNSINFKIFPLPNLIISNTNFKVKDSSINLKSKNLYIFLSLKNIYNYENFKANKIILEGNEVFLEINKVKDLVNYLKKIKYKLNIKALDINLVENNISLIKIKNINFLNYGYNKNRIEGTILEKKFQIFFKDKNKKINFKLLNTGIKANLKLNDKSSNSVQGSSRISMINNFLKFDFELNEDQLKITRSNFRNKDLSLSLDTLIKLTPFFNINSNIIITDFDSSFINKINLEKILKKKEIIKRLNSQIKISYKKHKYFNNFNEDYFFNFNLAHGRLAFTNKISLLDSSINCNGESLLTDEYPRINFDCHFNIKNKKNFFKNLSLSVNTNDKTLDFNAEGSLNLLYKKVNFKKIFSSTNYIANKEDMLYFKEKFESILFNDRFFKIFNKNKIKEFINEIS